MIQFYLLGGMYMKVGLVLEGGAMRGMYTAGVLDVFMEKDISFDGIMGVSAGAAFGVNLLSKQKGRVIRYNKKYNSDPEYMGIKPLLTTGNIFNAEFAYHTVPFELDPFDSETYNKSNVPFYAVVTNLETGKPEYMQIKDVAKEVDILQASAAIPFVTKAVEINGQKYFDGGVSDSIPYQKMLDMGYDKVVVVLTRHKGYVKKPMNKALAKSGYAKHKEFCEAMIHRHTQYNDSVAKLEELFKEGKVFVIRPSVPIIISHMEKDPEKLQQVYDIGVSDANAYMQDMLDYLSQ